MTKFGISRLNVCTQSVLFAGVSLFAFSSLAHAQVDEPSADDDTQALDTVIVEGIRGSLRESLQTREESNVIVDVLSASDFLDFPDINAGDVLVRLPGVTGGAGLDSPNSLSIRGFSSEFGLTTLNGRLVTSDRSGRNVRTNLFPSALLGQAAVFKTPSASMIEGGLSGTVELSTNDPLESLERAGQDQLARLRVRAGFNEDVDDVVGFDDNDLRLDGSYRRSFLDGKLGIGVGFTYEDLNSATYTLGARSPELEGTNDTEDVTTVNGQSLTDLGFLSIVQTDYEIEAENEQSNSAAFIATYEPNNQWTFKTDILYSLEELEFDRAQLRHDSLDDAVTGTTDAFGFPIEIFYDDVRTNFEPRQRTEEIETITAGFNAAWRNDLWGVSADLFYSSTTLERNTVDTRLRINDQEGTLRTGEEFGTVGFSYADFDPNDPFGESLELSFIDLERVERDDESIAFRLDVIREVNFGLIESVEAGIRFEDREKFESETEDRFDRYDEDIITPEVLAGFQAPFLAPNGFYFIDGPSTAPQSWFHASAFQLAESFANEEAAGRLRTFDNDDALATGTVEEMTQAVYAQANFGNTLFGLPLRGNFGVRVVKTDVTGIGSRGEFFLTDDLEVEATDPVPFEDESDYTSVLPSLNIVLALTDDVNLRFGAAQTIARPSFAFLIPNQTLSSEQEEPAVDGEIGEITALTFNGGNSATEPYEANNLDLSIEWSPNRDTLVAVSGFYKELETIINGGRTLELGDFTTDFGTFPAFLNTNVNETPNDKDVFGLEIQAQTTFDFLPAPWNGLGVQANYSYIDSEITQVVNTESLYVAFNDDGTIAEFVEDGSGGVRQPLSDISEELFNLTLFYDYGSFSGRISGRWDSENFENQPVGNNTIVAEGRERYDASASYDLTDNFTLSVQGRNLTNENIRRFHAQQQPITDPEASAQPGNLSINNRHREVQFGGREVLVGITYRY